MKKFYVVDQNFFRLPALAELVQDKKNRFVIPDAAFFEMSKAAEWKSTYLNSLRFLAQSPSSVFLSKSVGEVLNEETTTRKASTKIISQLNTQLVRGLLCEIKAGVEGPVFARFESGMVQSQTDFIQPRLDHEKNKKSVRALLETIKSSMHPDLVRGLKNHSVPESEYLDGVRGLLPHVLDSLFDDLNMSKEARKSFVKKMPMIARHTYLKIIMCCDWIVKNGFDCIKAEKITNDLLDHEYVIAATYFDSLLLSKESKAQDSLRKLHYVIYGRFPSNHIATGVGDV
jgi:hypothetical protein